MPEANFGIEKCIRGTKERNAVFLCSETDYMLTLQTTKLPYPKQLFRFITDSQSVGIVKK